MSSAVAVLVDGSISRAASLLSDLSPALQIAWGLAIASSVLAVWFSIMRGGA